MLAAQDPTLVDQAGEAASGVRPAAEPEHMDLVVRLVDLDEFPVDREDVAGEPYTERAATEPFPAVRAYAGLV